MGAKVGEVAKHDRQSDLLEWVGLVVGDGIVLGQRGACDPQSIEGLDVYDVEAVVPVHEHLGEAL